MTASKLEIGQECRFVLIEGEEPERGKVVGVDGEEYSIADSKGAVHSGRVNIGYRVEDGVLKDPVAYFRSFMTTNTFGGLK